MEKQQQQPIKGNDTVPSATPWQAFLVHLICGLELESALRVADNVYSVNLISDPSHTLRLICVVEAPIVILIYSPFRKSPKQCSVPPENPNWSLLMSLFTVGPAASVFGSSWTDWQRIFAHTKPSGSMDYMICLPAHGAVIGAWLGAWPMPLDWERPWQEWSICVGYGAAIAGYLVAMVASFGFVHLRG